MKLIKKVSFSLFLLVSLTYLFVVISPKIIKGFYPFGVKTAIVLTGSMEPTLKINDFVIVKKPKSINVNDIVTYKNEGDKNEVLHRVVRLMGDTVVTKGDANNVEDEPIKIDQITGVYVRKVRFLGKIIYYMTKPIVFSITMTLIVLLMLIPVKKENENQKK